MIDRLRYFATEVAVYIYWLLLMIVILVVVAPVAFAWALAQDTRAWLRR